MYSLGSKKMMGGRGFLMGETFTGLADRYETWFVNNREIFQSELALLKDMLPNFSRGLEIGVGTGIFAEALGISTGVEPSEEMALRAESRGIEVFREKGEKLSFENESFDLMAMITVDCFLSDLAQTLKEAHRILVPGGSLAIGFIDKSAPLGKIYEGKKHHNEFYCQANFHSGDEIIQATEKAGFEITEKGQTIFSLKNEFQVAKAGLGEGLFGLILAKKLETN
jgi:SAM-dependent methyltransferase